MDDQTLTLFGCETCGEEVREPGVCGFCREEAGERLTSVATAPPNLPKRNRLTVAWHSAGEDRSREGPPEAAEARCSKGHLLEGENLTLRRKGSGAISRICKTCERERKRTFRERHGAVPGRRGARGNERAPALAV